MKGYTSANIRNVALLGHGGCGKTTFIEGALKTTGAITKTGRVEDGNTVSDYDKLEKERGYSINTSIVPVEWKGSKINFIDTPGYFDFIGEVNAALRAAGAAVILVDAGAGIQVGTEMAWKACERYKMPRFIVINKRDKDEFDFDKTFSELKDRFGSSLIPLSWPLSAEIDDDLKEAIASSDDELMEKYFNGEEFTDEEIKKGMVEGISAGEIVPVCSSAFHIGEGIEGLLDLLVQYVPTPLQHGAYKGFNDKNEQVEVMSVTDAPLSAFVFKTIVDPFVGKISIMKVITGKLEAGATVYNERADKDERIGKLFFLRGKEQIDLNYAEAGDICAVSKLQYTLSGDTLCDKDNIIRYMPLDYPKPTYYIAIEAEKKDDEEKMSQGLTRLREEDPSFVVERNSETHQTLLGGQGDIQLSVILEKLKDRFGVSVKTVPIKIAYRETIKGTSDVQGKHKKQTGGAGQYGDVHIRFSPSDKDFEFSEEVFGGA
ncbi:MAG: elongation factor G, partial [Anaerovoracaceae bacterium]